ncbi:hypothetical protein FITA111629_11435 [Filibacter tadaridae]|uniref:Uncharacterized protein n=2 Tax=Filibacter tadaridae TaxID=2483811 RepID=A0A3P5WHQ2_9BACL|nr:hypothetical protein FILTAD_00484 [Filibacter tadaridae]
MKVISLQGAKHIKVKKVVDAKGHFKARIQKPTFTFKRCKSWFLNSAKFQELI